MQVFVIGKTKSGKSSLAHWLQEAGFSIYEAGAWARREFAQVNTGSSEEESYEFKENLTQFAMSKLKEDPNYSLKNYERFRQYNNEKCIKLAIAGVRNPYDFKNMVECDSDNRVIFIDSEQKMLNGAVENFEKGIVNIREICLEKGLPIFEVSSDDIFKDKVQEFLDKASIEVSVFK